MKKTVVHLPLGAPISSASVVDRPPRTAAPAPRPQNPPNRQIQQALAVLQKAAEQMQETAQRLFASHREQLIRLSIEIAARILAKEIQDQNYQIEAILRQALEGIGSDRPMTIRLNPQDLQTIQQTAAKSDGTDAPLIRWIPDPTIQPAECVIETEEGIIEWIIEEHLRRISDALLSGVQTHDKNGNENLLD